MRQQSHRHSFTFLLRKKFRDVLTSGGAHYLLMSVGFSSTGTSLKWRSSLAPSLRRFWPLLSPQSRTTKLSNPRMVIWSIFKKVNLLDDVIAVIYGKLDQFISTEPKYIRYLYNHFKGLFSLPTRSRKCRDLRISYLCLFPLNQNIFDNWLS